MNRTMIYKAAQGAVCAATFMAEFAIGWAVEGLMEFGIDEYKKRKEDKKNIKDPAKDIDPKSAEPD